MAAGSIVISSDDLKPGDEWSHEKPTTHYIYVGTDEAAAARAGLMWRPGEYYSLVLSTTRGVWTRAGGMVWLHYRIDPELIMDEGL